MRCRTFFLFCLLAISTTVHSQISSAPPAIIIHPPAYSTALEGQTVRMTCAAYGVPAPTITWSKNTGDIAAMLQDTNSGVKAYLKMLTVNGTDFVVSVLEICGAAAIHTDEYSCWANNGVSGVGIAASYAQFFLSVTLAPQEPPSLVVQPPQNTTVEYGTTVEIVCVAYGNPVPSVSWTRSGCSNMSASPSTKVYNEIVTYNGVPFRKSVLQLCNVGESDTDWYSCSAFNGIDGIGLVPNRKWWQLSVLPSPLPSSSSVLWIPSSSSMMMSTSSSITSGSPTPTLTVGTAGLLGSEKEAVFVVIIILESVVVVVLIVVVVVIALFAFKYVKRRADKMDIPGGGTGRDPDLHMDRGVSNPLRMDDDDGFEDEAIDSSMTYAELAKKIEDDDKGGLVTQ